MDGRILVTGARGRLARALAARGGERVDALPRAELDILDPDAVERALDRRRPAAVINTAAISRLEAAEADPGAAFAVNATAPGRLAEACARAGVPLIHISTDYVFGAPTERAWREDDPVSPLNAYGRSKAEGETRVLAAAGRACVVRVAWLFGDGEDFICHLLRSGAAEVRVAEDQVGSPTPVQPLAERLIALALRMAAGEAGLPPILHLAGTPPVARADWVEVAFGALARAGVRPPGLVRAPMQEFQSAAVRPRFSALDGSLSAGLFGDALGWRAYAARPETFLSAADNR